MKFCALLQKNFAYANIKKSCYLKQKMKKTKTIWHNIRLLGTLIIGGISMLPASAMALANSVYITPSSVSTASGSSFSVQLRITPDTSINAVQADVDYNQSLLSYQSSSLGAFSLCTQDSGGGGVVQFACAIPGGSSVNTDSLIATINFQAISGGNTSLNVTNQNAVSSTSETFTNPSASGASVSISGGTTNNTPVSGGSSPAPAPARTYTPAKTYYTPSTSATPTSSTPTPTPTTAKPATKTPSINITSNSPLNIGFESANINIQLNQAANGKILYGTSPSNLDLTKSITLKSGDNKLNLSQSGLLPGTIYYYRIQLSNGSSNYLSKIQNFVTKGLTLQMTVLGNNNQPLKNQLVTLHSQRPLAAKTNSKGIATFYDVAPGLHHLQIVESGKTLSEPVYVTNNVQNNKTSAPQQAAVVFSDYKLTAGISNYMDVIIIAIFLVFGALCFLAGIRSRHLLEEAIGKCDLSSDSRKEADKYRPVNINRPHPVA